MPVVDAFKLHVVAATVIDPDPLSPVPHSCHANQQKTPHSRFLHHTDFSLNQLQRQVIEMV